MSNSSIWPIDRTLSGATTPGQSGPGSNGNEEVFCIPQSSRITGASPSDCLGHSFGGVLPLCRGAFSVFYSPIQYYFVIVENIFVQWYKIHIVLIGMLELNINPSHVNFEISKWFMEIHHKIVLLKKANKTRLR